MNGIIHQAVMRIKDDVGSALDPETIETVCRTVGHTWRERDLGPAATVQGFLLQILHGNTACSNVPRLLGKQVTAKAYNLARGRLPFAVLQQLLAIICNRLGECVNDTGRWFGHRVWVMDGTGCSMPDTPELQKAFGQPPMQQNGCGFPVAHLVSLFHVGTGMLMRVVAAPLRTGDMALAKYLHGELQRGDIVIADRAFGSFGHLAALAAMGAHGLFRVQQTRVVSFRDGRASSANRRRQGRHVPAPTGRWVKRLGDADQIVEYVKPRVRPSWLTPEEWRHVPRSILVRELRYSLTASGYRSRTVTLVTTLLDGDRYPKHAIINLYAQRWQVETNIRHLKVTLGMDVLHTKSVDGIHKELAMFAIAYNLVRLVMLEAATRQKVPPARISFVDALRWLLHAGPNTRLTPLIVLPERPGRCEPRVRKRRPKNYPPMSRPRAVLTQALWTQGLTP
jgi:hypothetical protein